MRDVTCYKLNTIKGKSPARAGIPLMIEMWGGFSLTLIANLISLSIGKSYFIGRFVLPSTFLSIDFGQTNTTKPTKLAA